MASLAAATLSAPASAQVAPESLGRAFRDAGPVQRVQALTWLRQTHPELRGEVRRELETSYPDFQLRVWRAMAALHQEQPGRFKGLALDLIQELEGEPVEAALDVAEAALERYPHLPRRLAELRRQHGPGLAVRELVARQYPDFRTAFLELAPSPPGNLRRLLAGDFSDLRRGVVRDLSQLVDERYPELPAQLIQARRRGERPLAWLRDHRPEVLLEGARTVHSRHGQRLRELAVACLSQPARPSAWGPVLEMVSRDYPHLPNEAWWARYHARSALRDAVLAEFGDLPLLAARTLQERHPDLVSRALEVVERRHPELKQDVWNALEAEMPGLQERVRSILADRYPDLWPQLVQRLKS